MQVNASVITEDNYITTTLSKQIARNKCESSSCGEQLKIMELKFYLYIYFVGYIFIAWHVMVYYHQKIMKKQYLYYR